MESTALARVVAGNGIIPRPNWLERILTMYDVHKTRIDLGSLDDNRLRDLGLTRDQVEEEIRRKPWDPPEFFYKLR
ncbi:DUF1127 domain-containing protein [Palleronia caenipelagi]|nr:DUF1127 domain-containing protein [Palleronia caenipelagi]